MFKQLSNRVSAKTIEETYTENDVEHVVDENNKQTTDISAGYNQSTGFTFDYPMRWLNDQSDFKAIGIRRLKVIPTSHVLTLKVYVEYKKLPTQTVPSPKMQFIPPYILQLSILSENSLEEIIQAVINELNEWLAKKSVTTEKLSFGYSFDYRTGELKLSLPTPEELDEIYFHFDGGGGTEDLKTQNLNYFLKFLNQERTATNRSMLKSYSKTFSFNDVWDRSSLQFHASFSDNRRGFIGLNNDFYENPSIFYDPPTNTSNFWIRFTTDGKHQILPRYCRFYIGLCYVRNYKNSLVTK